MTGKKNTVANRARHRPKSNLGNAMIAKLLKFLHHRSVMVAGAIGTAVGAWLFAKGWVDEESSIAIAGAVTTILCVAANMAVAWISTRYIREKQTLKGLTPDGWAGPKTREATHTPKLHADGTPILRAEPVLPKPPTPNP